MKPRMKLIVCLVTLVLAFLVEDVMSIECYVQAEKEGELKLDTSINSNLVKNCSEGYDYCVLAYTRKIKYDGGAPGGKKLVDVTIRDCDNSTFVNCKKFVAGWKGKSDYEQGLRCYYCDEEKCNANGRTWENTALKSYDGVGTVVLSKMALILPAALLLMQW